MKKPIKKNDKELWGLIEDKLENKNYIFLKHAKIRQQDRNITDIDVLDILENKCERKRKRNKRKDTYTQGYSDWNYCVEGNNLEGEKIRIIISFDSTLMLVITVIRLTEKVK
jgi:hypothetical protein